ncbi:MAG: penicillin-insensitive murein endopeptidase, partial [Deltaproteobacteria bacterium]|nr:penicillin-insensitive murein endopeptidase [Deltaproteobacteria bacterium]
GLNRVVERYPGTADVVIGALSKEGGGRLKPHKSHRNGLDIDIGYYYKDNVQLKYFTPMNEDNLDVEKTFFLIESLISTGMVEYIFMNYSLQKLFHEHAQELGYGEDALDELFQYPGGKKTKAGIIRHAKGHNKHFHVRIYSLEMQATEDVE